jgi:hypothetical protein
MKQPKGFIALISSIIIAAILLLVVVEGSLSSIYSRMNSLDAESKERSVALADACVDALLLRISNGQTIQGTVAVGSDTCQITNSSSPYKIQAVYNTAYTNLLVGIDPDTLTILSWSEVAVLQ